MTYLVAFKILFISKKKNVYAILGDDVIPSISIFA
jgi:hypothetical protein